MSHTNIQWLWALNGLIKCKTLLLHINGVLTPHFIEFVISVNFVQCILKRYGSTFLIFPLEAGGILRL